MAIMNNVSVWWHVVGATLIVLILIFIPDQHQSFSYVFTERLNNSGYDGGSTSSFAFWFAILPFAFLLTQYTITGFDACAHLSEETEGASMSAAKGIWQSIFYSAVGGYILLLAVTFAIPNDANGNPDNATAALGVQPIFLAALDKNWATFVLFISASAQFFCATSCMTSASRMTYAFSRDGAIPGSETLKKLTPSRVPANAVMFVAVAAMVVTLPALIKLEGTTLPLAFFAVTSIAVIGLYVSFAIPIFLRWRHGENFEVGRWNNGAKYRWMNPVAVAEIIIVSLYLMLPTTPFANPFYDEFELKYLNYTPVVTLGALIILTIWWNVSAKNWFTGPKHTIDEAVVKAFDD
jgi:amino acid transporter